MEGTQLYFRISQSQTFFTLTEFVKNINIYDKIKYLHNYLYSMSIWCHKY
jgi:hypothetical protein